MTYIGFAKDTSHVSESKNEATTAKEQETTTKPTQEVTPLLKRVPCKTPLIRESSSEEQKEKIAKAKQDAEVVKEDIVLDQNQDEKRISGQSFDCKTNL